MSGKRFYSPKELVDVLSVSPATIRRRLKDGTIKSCRLSGRIIVPVEAIDKLVASALGKEA
jgi:predicted site-specific integrase-resolvase